MAKHEIRDSVHTFLYIDGDERSAVDSIPIQRLRHIHQLAMSYLVYPGATHKRFEHSLGVMELAGRVFDVITREGRVHREVVELLPELREPHQLEYWRRVLRMAALFHDVGHIPFSHATERNLLPDGWDHERLSLAIITSPQMEEIWKSVTPPLRSSDIGMLAVGPKKFKDREYTDWQAILAEIIVGDAFGVDRMDYLLRDSHHAGVAYGRFDHFRLIDTLRILPAPAVRTKGGDSNEPQLGVEEGGLHSAEAMLLARYFMFTQVYYHPVRRIYDVHLGDFLSKMLPEEKFPTDVESHLKWTDAEITAEMRRCAVDPAMPGHSEAQTIMNREHFKRLYSKSAEDVPINDDPARAIFEAAAKKFGDDKVRRDFSKASGSLIDYPVMERDGRVVSARAKSDVLAGIPGASFDYVFVHAGLLAEAKRWLESSRQKILEQGLEKEEV